MANTVELPRTITSEIDAPDNFVTVYHETQAESLASILLQGLLVDYPPLRQSPGSTNAHVNQSLDNARPESVRQHGVSRSNIFGFLNLAAGSGCSLGPGGTDLDALLELKVDPTQAWVGDIDIWTEVKLATLKGDGEAVRDFAESYWGSLVRLDDYSTYYETDPERPEFAWSVLKPGATPDGMPWHFTCPEVLIPHNVPPQHLRVLP